MDFNNWFLLVGVLLLLMVLLGPRLRRLPISTAILYLAVGYAIATWRWLVIDPIEHYEWLERLSEIAVIVSLFSTGLKLRLPLSSTSWRLPVALAFVSMIICVGLVALAGVYGLGLSWGAAVVLGAVLAPTDPVLASDVQVENSLDTDPVRFTLTGEAGLNDGTAFPFVMLGLGLLGLHELGPGAWRWWTIDVLWAIVGGLLLGLVCGTAVARLVIYLRRTHREATGLDDFLAMGLIAITYGLALAVHVYGFLAVFAAGLALRTVERKLSHGEAPPQLTATANQESELATDPERAPAFMAEAVLYFNEHLERISELTLVLIVGVVLASARFSWESLAMAATLLFVIRPLAVLPVALVARLRWQRAGLISWFGVRGIGSVYYLYYAVGHGLDEPLATRLISITLWTIAFSILAHGITVTPLMAWYGKQSQRTAS